MRRADLAGLDLRRRHSITADRRPLMLDGTDARPGIGDVSAHRGRRADLADIEDRLVPIWHAKPARTMQVLPLGLELTVSIEHLDAVVLAVSNIDPAIGVTADVVNDVEFAFPGAGLTPRQHKLSVGRVFVDPRIAVPVRDVHIALGRGLIESPPLVDVIA